jgi:hypothetical protein
MNVEAPIIMIMSASTALVRDGNSFIKLSNFTYILNGAVTLMMAIFLVPPVFNVITQGLMRLPENVAHLTHVACIILIPWPAAHWVSALLSRGSHPEQPYPPSGLRDGGPPGHYGIDCFDLLQAL